MSDSYPIGSILPYAGVVSQATEGDLFKRGLLPCDGRALSRTSSEYDALYAVIGEMYGADDNDFYLPDYRGRFVRGTDYGAGRDVDASERTAPQPGLSTPGNSGDEVGSLQDDALIKHYHTYEIYTDYHKVNYLSAVNNMHKYYSTETETSGSSGGKETRPVNAYINFVIVFS